LQPLSYNAYERLNEKASERAGEKSGKKESVKEWMKECQFVSYEGAWEKIISLISLRKKKSIISSTLYHSVILACPSVWASCLTHYYFCIEIPSFFILLLYHFFLYFLFFRITENYNRTAFAGNRPFRSHFLWLVEYLHLIKLIY